MRFPPQAEQTQGIGRAKRDPASVSCGAMHTSPHPPGPPWDVGFMRLTGMLFLNGSIIPVGLSDNIPTGTPGSQPGKTAAMFVWVVSGIPLHMLQSQGGTTGSLDPRGLSLPVVVSKACLLAWPIATSDSGNRTIPGRGGRVGGALDERTNQLIAVDFRARYIVTRGARQSCKQRGLFSYRELLNTVLMSCA
ncbi:hypothetical protein JZ751_006264 [Albula glossodonta]|uniref:Uncharacterized protein n=1 Tax=Albula glossodonta TaxID=121402 RepID=A0A8T2NB82_9TELE|nr:hypothetical protein JZ751_006264 [Albula glossodonta]